MKHLMREFADAVWQVFKLPFFLVAEGFRRLFALGWRKLTMLSVAAVVLTVVVLFLFFEVTSHPAFCNSCHIMTPYIEAWETSSHADVDCMKCHAGTDLEGYIETKFTAVSMLANYVTGLYKRSRPWAEIEDANCLRGGCHETRLLAGRKEFIAGVAFDHEPHLSQTRRGRKLRCTSCHSQIVQGEHISVTTTTCFLCHFKNVEAEGREELANCRTCHSRLPGTALPDSVSRKELATGVHSTESALAMTPEQQQEQKPPYDHTWIAETDLSCSGCHPQMWQGEGEVDPERCGACHSQAAHIERIDDLEFIHEWHIEKRKVDCVRCHSRIEHQTVQADDYVSGNCDACHSGPHNPALAVYQGEGSRLLERAMPDTMASAGVVCVACHRDPITGMSQARTPSESACTPCHEQNYRGLVGRWKSAYGSRIDQLEDAMQRGGGHAQQEDARHDLALLRAGGAWHNPRFADEVLDRVAEVAREMGRSVPAAVSVPTDSRGCLSCHGGIQAVEVELPYSSFDHVGHFSERGISCSSCHNSAAPENSSHGQRLEASGSCNACHHMPSQASADESCVPCHEPSRRLYNGELPGLDAEPSTMAMIEMGCIDCHSEEIGYSVPDDESCLMCHGEEVVSDLEFKRGELLKLLRTSRASGSAANIVRLDAGRAVHHPDLAKDVLGGLDKE